MVILIIRKSMNKIISISPQNHVLLAIKKEVGVELYFNDHFPIFGQFSHQIQIKIGQIHFVRRLKIFVKCGFDT